MNNLIELFNRIRIKKVMAISYVLIILNLVLNPYLCFAKTQDIDDIRLYGVAAAENPEYAQQLRNAGFPESYISDLCQLHTMYPQWIFEAVNTGLDWNTVLQNESTKGKNLVPKSVDDSRKSIADGDYDWNKNTWTVYDSSSWVGANPDYIAYCMDPRNFLDETYIFQFESLSYKNSQNINGVQAVIANTFMANPVTDTDGSTLSYAQAFVDIGSASGVSPYHLAARVKQEQGILGNSSLISGKYKGYEGYFNYFNVSAYGATSDVVIKSGLAYAKKQGWNTRYKALAGGAELLSKNYIKKGQDTLYFQKFNVVYVQSLYNHQYMGNVSAAITEARNVAAGYKTKNQPFTFRIPVYNNMPASAVKFIDNGNPNNYLKKLSIDGAKLTPVFTGEVTEYSLAVTDSVSSLNISAEAVSPKATIMGVGTVTLKAGDNILTVSCKSQSGKIRNYTINVKRTENVSTNVLSSNKYNIGEYITGIQPGTTTGTVLKNITTTNGSIKILNSSGKNKGGKVATGDKISVFDAGGKVISSYKIVIYGDINGDGSINTSDITKLNKYILGKAKLSGPYLEAADVNRKKDGINAIDIILLNRHILGQSKIKQ